MLLDVQAPIGFRVDLGLKVRAAPKSAPKKSELDSASCRTRAKMSKRDHPNFPYRGLLCAKDGVSNRSP